MFKKNLFLRIFFYSILVVSSIHFINIKAMIESRFDSHFVFENFSARAADDLLSADLIVPKEPSIASNFANISNGMININGINELDYTGYFKDSDKFSFSQQSEGFWGKNIGYFRFKIVSPYPEAESVVYVVNNGEQYTYNLIDGFFEIDHPLAEKKDGINWSPVDLKTQNLLIKFIDKDGKEIGVKALVITNSFITQKQPTMVTFDEISSEITPASIIKFSDGKVSLKDIVLNKDGSTNLAELNFTECQNVGNPALRYLDFSFNLSDEEASYPELSFLVNNIPYESSSNDFIISYDKENKKVKIYFAVAKIDADKNLIPYYSKNSIGFSVLARFKDEAKVIKKEKSLYVSFNFSDKLASSDSPAFPVEQVSFRNEALRASNGYIGFNSDIFFYQGLDGEYLVDRQLNSKHHFSKDLLSMKELNPDCRYVKFSLDFNSKFAKFISLSFDNKEEELYYDFLKQDNNSVYILNQQQGLDLYYPVACLVKTETENYWKNNYANKKWKIAYFDETTKKEFKYSFEVNLNVLGVCNRSEGLIDLPTEAFNFEDAYLNKGSQKRSGLLSYNDYLSPDIQKRYIDQNVSKFSGSDNLRYFKININDFKFNTNLIIGKKERLAKEAEAAKYKDKTEAEKAAADKTEAEKAAADKTEAEKAAADKAEAEKAAADKAEAEKAAADKTEAEKAAADKTEAEKAAADKAEAEKAAADKTEAEKAAADKTEAEKAAADKAEAEKAAADKAEAEKAAADKTEAEKAAADKTEAEKAAADKTEAEKAAADKAEAEKAAADKAEAEKAAADKAEAEKAAADKAEKDLERLTFSNVENIKEFKGLVIVEKDSIYIPAFNYSSKNIKPYSFDQALILNFMDDSYNIYQTKLRVISKPIIDKKIISSSPVMEAKPIKPEYKETYNPITGKLTREKIEKSKENQIISTKENNKITEIQLLTEAQMIDRSPKKEIKTMLLSSVKIEKEDKGLEKGVEVKHQSLFTNNSTSEVKISLKNYLAYGTQSTLRLGEGQRAATVINYTNVKGDVPKTESDIEDVLKIANNKTPLLRNTELESKLLGNFQRLNNIIEENDIIKIDKDNLILELNQFLRFSYGILSIDRDLARERWAIELFVKNYNKLPQTSGEWRIVNSWAYRNILVDQVENNLDWINTASSKYPNVTVDLLSEFFDLSKK